MLFRRIYISYRRIRDAMAAGKEGFVELSKFFKQGGEGEAIPLWAYVLPERVYSELNAAFEDEHNTDSQKTVHLPGDIERGQTCDPFFNAIQENLVNRGTMIKHVMGKLDNTCRAQMQSSTVSLNDRILGTTNSSRVYRQCAARSPCCSPAAS